MADINLFTFWYMQSLVLFGVPHATPRLSKSPTLKSQDHMLHMDTSLISLQGFPLKQSYSTWFMIQRLAGGRGWGKALGWLLVFLELVAVLKNWIRCLMQLELFVPLSFVSIWLPALLSDYDHFFIEQTGFWSLEIFSCSVMFMFEAPAEIRGSYEDASWRLSRVMIGRPVES